MVKPDDSTLSPHDLKIVETRAHKLLSESAAWEQYPVPIADILAAAKVTLAPKNAFDPAWMASYLKDKAHEAENKIKAAVSKVLGLYDAEERIIHIDNSVRESKKNFLMLHETGHHEIPAHRKMFRFFQDCLETLSPEIADHFEREANNFARYVLFKGQSFADMASDSELGIKTPMSLAKKFGASVYASCREYARTNHRECMVYVLEQPTENDILGPYCDVRRIECSPSFEHKFGTSQDQNISEGHILWPIIPFYRKMTKPTAINLKDRNGQMHECLAEAFDTTFNVIILIYPVQSLTKTMSQAKILVKSDAV